MAKTKYPTPSPELIAGDVAVAIRPRGYADWRGSAAQLAAEGLIPSGFEWPQKTRGKEWSKGGLDYYVLRIRPPGSKGPCRTSAEGDYWWLRTTSTAQGRDGFAAARLYEAQEALKQEIALQKSGSLFGLFGSEAWRRAHTDKAFQRFIQNTQRRQSPTPSTGAAA